MFSSVICPSCLLLAAKDPIHFALIMRSNGGYKKVAC